MRIEFLKTTVLRTHVGFYQQFNPGQTLDLPQRQGMRLLRAKGPSHVRTVELVIDDRVRAKRVCPLPLRSPDYTPPTMVTGRVVEIDHARMMVKIETLTHSDFWAPTTHVRKL